jgi:hypothetical protein
MTTIIMFTNSCLYRLLVKGRLFQTRSCMFLALCSHELCSLVIWCRLWITWMMWSSCLILLLVHIHQQLLFSSLHMNQSLNNVKFKEVDLIWASLLLLRECSFWKSWWWLICPGSSHWHFLFCSGKDGIGMFLPTLWAIYEIMSPGDGTSFTGHSNLPQTFILSGIIRSGWCKIWLDA